MNARQIDKKQFIAGAVCPECDAADRIVVEIVFATAEMPQLSRRRCVDCGFADPFGTAPAGSSGGIPKGRPERPRVAATRARLVNIMDVKRDDLS